MLPIPKKQKSQKTEVDSQREALIAALRAEVEIQERCGQFNTVHHEMLNRLLGENPEPVSVVEETKEIE